MQVDEENHGLGSTSSSTWNVGSGQSVSVGVSVSTEDSRDGRQPRAAIRVRAKPDQTARARAGEISD